MGTRHELLAIEVVDPRELELPDVGLLTVVDPESGQTLEVPTGDAEFRARFAQGARRALIPGVCRAAHGKPGIGRKPRLLGTARAFIGVYGLSQGDWDYVGQPEEIADDGVCARGYRMQ